MTPVIAPAALPAYLRRHQPLAAVALVGADSYWRRLCRKQLLEAFVPEGARDWAIARFSAADVPLDRVLRQAATRPMLAPHQVILLEGLEAFERRSEQAREEIFKQLEAYLDDPAPFTLLVFEAESLDQRTRLARLLGRKALVVQFDAPGDTAAQSARALARALARDRGLEIDDEAAALLSELAGGQAARLETEIEKVAAYAGDRKRITAADVAELVVDARNYTVWELAEVLATGARRKALEFLDGLLRAGEPAPRIVGTLAWMYRKLLEAQELSPRLTPGEAARRLGMHPQSAGVALAQARKIPRQNLRAGLVALAEADDRLKSGRVDHRAVMEFLLARLTRPLGRRSMAESR